MHHFWIPGILSTVCNHGHLLHWEIEKYTRQRFSLLNISSQWLNVHEEGHLNCMQFSHLHSSPTERFKEVKQVTWERICTDPNIFTWLLLCKGEHIIDGKWCWLSLFSCHEMFSWREFLKVYPLPSDWSVDNVWIYVWRLSPLGRTTFVRVFLGCTTNVSRMLLHVTFPITQEVAVWCLKQGLFSRETYRWEYQIIHLGNFPVNFGLSCNA